MNQFKCPFSAVAWTFFLPKPFETCMIDLRNLALFYLDAGNREVGVYMPKRELGM